MMKDRENAMKQNVLDLAQTVRAALDQTAHTVDVETQQRIKSRWQEKQDIMDGIKLQQDDDVLQPEFDRIVTSLLKGDIVPSHTWFLCYHTSLPRSFWLPENAGDILSRIPGLLADRSVRVTWNNTLGMAPGQMLAHFALTSGLNSMGMLNDGVLVNLTDVLRFIAATPALHKLFDEEISQLFTAAGYREKESIVPVLKNIQHALNP